MTPDGGGPFVGPATRFFRALFFAVWAYVGLVLIVHWFFSSMTPLYITIDGVEHSYRLGPKEKK